MGCVGRPSKELCLFLSNHGERVTAERRDARMRSCGCFDGGHRALGVHFALAMLTLGGGASRPKKTTLSDNRPAHGRRFCGNVVSTQRQRETGCAKPLFYGRIAREAPHFRLTLGVADLERSLAFYRDGLGLHTPGIVGREFEHGAVAFFDLSNGVKLAIWDQDDLAHDSGLTKAPASSTSFSIGYNVSQRSEVDEVMEQAREAGAAIVKPAQETFYGDMRATSPIPMAICGRSCGIRAIWRRGLT